MTLDPSKLRRDTRDAIMAGIAEVLYRRVDHNGHPSPEPEPEPKERPPASVSELPEHLAQYVTGDTDDERAASTARVLAAYNATAPAKPRGPRPDPSQGQQGAPTVPTSQKERMLALAARTIAIGDPRRY